ncbi:Uncharacterized membrane protein [Lachnospiraceae bacterium XBB1006]|nr:Uncharacterized membrane protein [Lachnospiraceae bacterium XBB1006]
MNKREYLSQLRDFLSCLPVEDQMDALLFYQTYFEDAGEENEQSVIDELGSPEEVARKIIAEQGIMESVEGAATSGEFEQNSYQTYHDDADHTTHKHSSGLKSKLDNWTFYQEHKSGCIILLILAAIFTIPVWGGVVGGIFGLIMGVLGILIGLFAAVFAIGIGCFVGGIACIIAGIAILVPTCGLGLFVIGIGLLLLALSALAWSFSGVLCFQFLPWCYRSIVGLFKKSTQTVGGASA